MMLADKVESYPRQLGEFLEELYASLLGKRPTVEFEPVDVQDVRVVAEVSKMLVESGIKTKEEVEERYWRWKQ